MQSRALTGSHPEQSWIVVLDEGDEAVSCLTAFARDAGVAAGRFTALGAFSRAVLGFFDVAQRDYHRIDVNEQVEVASMIGNFARDEEAELRLHPHAILSGRDGRAIGGHLLEGYVRPTLEVLVTVSPAELPRRTDKATGLPLIDLEALT